MTRDEASKIFAKFTGGSRETNFDWVDGFVALGMLKLHEPNDTVTSTGLHLSRC